MLNGRENSLYGMTASKLPKWNTLNGLESGQENVQGEANSSSLGIYTAVILLNESLNIGMV